ncbi:DUF5716 family protein [[Clostridium] colinum]|uniref:DUF5716 family protein n=1 Tax=[Clostridium] colinum TaxID=36835 RepID=UPI002024C4D8|nr:DUF5716 family protein [[Clostridium] colinum]
MINENKFIIGIDLGNLTSTISYFDFNQMDIDVVDVSGGYGKASVPTVVSYNIDTGDWIFGEYAILNKGFANEIIIDNIVDNLGKGLTYTVKDKNISLTLALSKFILFLIENIKNINPNANIEGIVLSISSYANYDDVKEAFKLANIDHLLLKITNDKECILKSYFYENDIIGDKILIVDYSNRQLRASIYKIQEEGKIKCVKTYFNEKIGQQRLFNITKNLITKKFLEETGKIDLTEYEKNSLDSFVYQQFDIIFQRQSLSDIKLYYNFFYPPFQKIITKQEIFDIISFFEKEMNTFFNDLFQNIEIKENDIKNIILTGGGIEIDFIHKFIKSRFNLEKSFKTKAKRFISDGACITACQELGVLPKDKMYIEDEEQIKSNIGIFIKKLDSVKFEPFVYKNSFIWQKFDKKVFCLTNDKNIDINIALQENENFKVIENIKLNLNDYSDFDNSDVKTIRLLMYVEFKSNKQMIFNIEDFGFGDIRPKTQFKKQFIINI